MARSFLASKDVRLEDIIEKIGFEGNATIVSAKESINENDETRKRFEIMVRAVFRKFKACLNVTGINDHRRAYDAINIVYKSLQEDREQADISQIIKELHGIVGENIALTYADHVAETPAPYDISAIDFERLRQEFAKSPQKNTQVQNLKNAIEKRLALMLAQNPLRTDFQRHYGNLVAEYNREKDRVTIERTFEALLKLGADLDEEQERAVREGLDEPTLALFDLLKKIELTPAEIKRIKTVAIELHEKIGDKPGVRDGWPVVPSPASDAGPGDGRHGLRPATDGGPSGGCRRTGTSETTHRSVASTQGSPHSRPWARGTAKIG